MKRDRKEISRLKREILQLRRLLEEQEDQIRSAKEIIEEEESKDFHEQHVESPKCPKCRADLAVMDLGARGTYKVCNSCGHRAKHK